MKASVCLLVTSLLFLYSHLNAQTIAVNDVEQVAGATFTVCQGEKLTLKALNFLPGTKYSWTVPDKAQKAVKKDAFDINIDSVLVEQSGTYIVTDSAKRQLSRLIIKVARKPDLPQIMYTLTSARLVIVDESPNRAPDNSFQWTLPDGSILKSLALAPLNVKDFDINSPKLSDLGDYKLDITNSAGCRSSAIIAIAQKREAVSPEKKALTGTIATIKKPKLDSTTGDTTWFFYGNIGGNVDLVNRKLTLNTVYTDLQFKPFLTLSDREQLKFPIRIYYNNGSGPQQSDPTGRQTFFTVDTLTLAKTKKVRYLTDRPLLVNQTESRTVGLNLPISYAYKLKRNQNWRLLVGLNLDFAWVTNRTFDYAFIDGDSTFKVVDNLDQALKNQPPPRIITSINGTSVTAVTPAVFDTIGYRPKLPIDRQYKYSQIYAGVQIGVEYQSTKYDFSLKYSYGATRSYIERGSPVVGGANQLIQLIFFEKSIGLQFLADVRFANVEKTADGTLTAAAAPYYYFSISKTINLSKLKEAFFP